MKIPCAPRYHEYFTQGERPYADLSWVQNEDLSWIDDLSEAAVKLKAKNAIWRAENFLDPSYVDSDEDIASKDFDSIDFPLSHHWPLEFNARYIQYKNSRNAKLKEIIDSAENKVSVDDVTVYQNCSDGNSYFTTPYYNYGSVELLDIDEDSEFDSAETAMYAFCNDYAEWDSQYGEKSRALMKISELEALRQPVGDIYTEIGTECECDGCGGFAMIISIVNDNALCVFCSK